MGTGSQNGEGGSVDIGQLSKRCWTVRREIQSTTVAGNLA